MLSGKKIIVAVSGSIAAYKAALLVRLFVKSRAEVKVVSTDGARKFVTDLTFSNLSQHPVFGDLWGGSWSEHVHLGTWADLMVIAPATANTLAKMAAGICDNALCAVYLSASCPVLAAPAMDADMYAHPATQKNLSTLAEHGVHLMPVGTGFLASGLIGQGRMAEPEDIFQRAWELLSTVTPPALSEPSSPHALSEASSVPLIEAPAKALADSDSPEGQTLRGNPLPLKGKKVLITAGPTREYLDPVRYLTNRSTGKMGYHIASEAEKLGATVLLISGMVDPEVPVLVNPQKVASASDMYEAVTAAAPEQDLIIMSAAVADYTPAETATQKIKKSGDDMSLKLVRTRDILKHLGEVKPEGQLLVGFALETHQEMEHAQAKLVKKNLDYIILNSLKDEGAGFGHDTNKITLLDKNGGTKRYPLKSKQEVARDILLHIIGQHYV